MYVEFQNTSLCDRIPPGEFGRVIESEQIRFEGLEANLFTDNAEGDKPLKVTEFSQLAESHLEEPGTPHTFWV